MVSTLGFEKNGEVLLALCSWFLHLDACPSAYLRGCFLTFEHFLVTNDLHTGPFLPFATLWPTGVLYLVSPSLPIVLATFPWVAPSRNNWWKSWTLKTTLWPNHLIRRFFMTSVIVSFIHKSAYISEFRILCSKDGVEASRLKGFQFFFLFFSWGYLPLASISPMRRWQWGESLPCIIVLWAVFWFPSVTTRFGLTFWRRLLPVLCVW